MASKVSMMMGLIKVGVVLKRSEKSPFPRMKKKHQHINVKGHIASQS